MASIAGPFGSRVIGPLGAGALIPMAARHTSLGIGFIAALIHESDISRGRDIQMARGIHGFYGWMASRAIHGLADAIREGGVGVPAVGAHARVLGVNRASERRRGHAKRPAPMTSIAGKRIKLHAPIEMPGIWRCGMAGDTSIGSFLT